MSDEIPSLEKLIKLMKMTTSPNDGEALTAIRLANRMLDSWKGDWEKILTGKVTVIGDPFANVSVRAPSRNAPPQPARRPQPAPRPQPKPQFNPGSFASSPQPAQPSPSTPQMSFTNVSGHWRVKSNVKLVINDHYEIPTRNSGLRRVKITAYDGMDNWGNHLYTSVNAPHNAGAML